jgi:hypothetical protein
MKDKIKNVVNKFLFESVYGDREQTKIMKKEIQATYPQLIAAAQKVYDEWDQDEDGIDEYYGSGGICDDIADEICQVIESLTPHNCFTRYDEYECHTSCYIYNVDTRLCFFLDIPYHVYETGGGYSWKKIKDVEFATNFIFIKQVDYDDFFDEDGDFINQY